MANTMNDVEQSVSNLEAECEFMAAQHYLAALNWGKRRLRKKEIKKFLRILSKYMWILFILIFLYSYLGVNDANFTIPWYFLISIIFDLSVYYFYHDEESAESDRAKADQYDRIRSDLRNLRDHGIDQFGDPEGVESEVIYLRHRKSRVDHSPPFLPGDKFSEAAKSLIEKGEYQNLLASVEVAFKD